MTRVQYGQCVDHQNQSAEHGRDERDVISQACQNVNWGWEGGHFENLWKIQPQNFRQIFSRQLFLVFRHLRKIAKSCH